MKKAIDEGGKEKIAALEKQSALDQIWIKVLEKKVQELKQIDDLNRNLVEEPQLDASLLLNQN
jgi:hypothetical protein